MALNINSLDLSSKNIIVVEDDVPSIRYYETLLKNAGADIRVFHNGKEFVDYINQGNIVADLIIMDFLIPVINGIDCVRVFRKERKSTPVLMITAYSTEQAKAESLIAGCNEYILKPVYPEKLYFLLNKYLKSEIKVAQPDNVSI